MKKLLCVSIICALPLGLQAISTSIRGSAQYFYDDLVQKKK